MSDRQETYIYESPDGGHTVYRRLVGQSPSEREIHSISDNEQDRLLQFKEDKLWKEIRQSARTDPVLKDLLDRAIIYHQLKSQP